MRRVLAPGGRLAIGIWGPLDGSPGMAALVAALERHVGSEAANNRRAPFALADPAEVADLLITAGFREVEVRTLTEMARFSSPEELIAAQLAATPMSTLGALTEESQRAIARDVRAALGDFMREDGLAVPMTAHLALAHA